MRYAIASLLMLLGLVFIPGSASATTPSWYLPPNVRLTVGHCIYSSGFYNDPAKMCMEYYGNVVTYYKGVQVDQWGANARFNSDPSGYLVVVPPSSIRIYEYSGGPLIWQWRNTLFQNFGLSVSATINATWCVALDKPGSYFWPWRNIQGCAMPG